ncbi:MAG: EamA family transporter [Candidatus Aenigmarchaeota archaeon]|nr:EamA family transporter [Candidatus Aenigmarchaeota archaeon]
MDWVFFALLSALFYSVNSVMSKILIDKRFDKPFPFSIFLTIIDLMFVVGVYFVFPISWIYPSNLYAVVVGVFISYCFYFFYHAMKNDEGSRAMSIMQTYPILVAVMSAVLLGEVLGFNQYAGIALIVASSALISHKRTESGRKRSASLKYALAFALMIAVYSIATKYLLGTMDYWSYFFWSFVGVTANVPFLLSFKSIRSDFRRLARMMDAKTLVVCIIKEGIWLVGDVLSMLAISLGPVAIVSALGSLQPFFVFVMATMLSLFMPNILKEDTGRGHLLEKLAAALMIFIGIWMIGVA